MVGPHRVMSSDLLNDVVLMFCCHIALMTVIGIIVTILMNKIIWTLTTKKDSLTNSILGTTKNTSKLSYLSSSSKTTVVQF